MDKTEEEIDAIWELRQEKVYEKEIKEEIIKESERGIWKIGERIYKVVEMLCIYTEEDDTDSDTIRALSILLRKGVIEQEKKSKIIEILERYRQKSKKKRAGNIFLNEIEILEKKVVLNSKPRQLIVELTTKCNLRCLMCDVCLQNHSINNTILNFIKSNIPYLERIKWQGGEVFLYDKFYELLELCNKYNVKQVIQTNGLLIDEKILKLLISKQIHLSFSIDSVEKEDYEKIRRGAKFENLMEIIKLLNDYKLKNNNFCYTMIMVVMSNNYNQINKTVEFAIKYGFQGVTFQKYMNHGNNDLLLTEQQKIEVINNIKTLREKYIKGEIPIQIYTSIPLENDEYLKMEEFVEINNNIIYKNNEQKDIVESNYNIIQPKKEDIVNEEKEDKYMNDKSKAEHALFCIVPWTELCISASNTLQFGAGSKTFQTIGFKYDEIWNCKELVKYRKNLVENNLSLCEKLCREREDDSNRIKLGLIM